MTEARTALVATDLDRTMIYSAAALAEGRTDGQDDDVRCVEYYEGAPLSYMTTRAADLLTSLASEVVVVPTTTRTVEQFRRIALPGAPWRHAITTNGATILVDGEPDLDWRRAVEDAVAGSAVPLAEVTAEMTRRGDDSWVLTQRTADELFCYLVVNAETMPEGFVDEFAHWCTERGWGVSRQGRKVYAMPDAVCKSHAVAEVRRRCVNAGTLEADAPVLAAGDGALDAEMLRAATAAIRPRHGELELLQWDAPGLVVTERSGGAASEEILHWFRATAGTSGSAAAPPTHVR
ncbi:hypothetical protein QE397_004053 [Rhodococcus sp. SORGH_AS 301]|nr:hypothetical protein [Rhodococcus sp. SORGH_AS_0301]